MQKTCKQCQMGFEITQDDLAFYEKVSPIFGGKRELVPPSQLCPDCQHQRRLAHRNERHLHRRTCDLTGKEIISFYSSRKPWKVYDYEVWWSDRWDPLSYGRPFDFGKSFFEQYAALQREVPRISMVVSHCENCSYSPYSVYAKNCYLAISCFENEDSYYCYQVNDSRNCVDSSLCTKCELCYECLCCMGLYQSAFCHFCENSTELLFCQECRGCTNCIGCKNLVNQKNRLFNKPASMEEIVRVRTSLRHERARREFATKVHEFFLGLPERATHLINCEHCTGDNLVDCKNAHECFDARDLEDCTYGYTLPKGGKDSRGFHYSPNAELVYDSMSAVNGYRVLFALHSWDCKNSLYVDECFFSEHLFGCIGLRRKEYCVLNKQYAKEEYEELLPNIIEHMGKTEEWGEYFPVALSPFAYNESIAEERCPLSKEEIFRRGWQWEDQVNEVPKVEKIIPANLLPDSIDDIPDDVLNWAIRCEATERPFRIIKQELAFYRKMRLPVPRLHPDERHRRRMLLRNPRKLWSRACAKCSKPIQTTYAPERPEIVYCETCYLQTVY